MIGEENRRFGDYAVVLVPNAGHFLQLERPEEFNRDLARWVESLDNRVVTSAD